jgi:hypothetical protein
MAKGSPNSRRNAGAKGLFLPLPDSMKSAAGAVMEHRLLTQVELYPQH